jgi:hypothetical protein
LLAAGHWNTAGVSLFSTVANRLACLQHSKNDFSVFKPIGSVTLCTPGTYNYCWGIIITTQADEGVILDDDVDALRASLRTKQH